MANFLKVAAVFGIAALAGCAGTAQPARHPLARCGERVAAMMAANDADIASHRYAVAAHNAEAAARASLACGDRWRGANALLVAAELEHQNGQHSRARTLLHESFSIMRTLRTSKLNEVTSSLLAERLNSAQHEMRGQWAYW